MITDQLGNLPPDLGYQLVGRDELADRLRRLVLNVTPLTLMGPGGVGKTHLAVHAAQTLQPKLHSAWLVDLSSLGGEVSLSRLYAHIAVEMGIRHLGDVGVEVILGHLRQGTRSDKPTLLVLDTCDRLIPQVHLVIKALMKAESRLRIIATCRERLALDGEQTIVVPPLQLPDSVLLFGRLAAAAGATEADLDPDALRELCRRLDGLPLAVKLAAGRARALTVRELLDRVEDRFTLLRDTTGSRHSGLRTLVDLSYESCEADEKLVWQRCSVFADSFTLAAAEAVAGHDELTPATVVDAVVRLVDKSVIGRLDGPGPARYAMLDTLREYGLRKLAGNGATDRARTRHSAYYLAAAAAAAAGWFGPDELATMAAIRRDLHESIAAIDHLVARGDLAAAAALCRDTTRTRAPFFWGYLDIMQQHLHRIIDLTPAPDSDAAAYDLAATLSTEAWIVATQGRHRLSTSLLAQARDLIAKRDIPTFPPLLFAAGASTALLAGDPEAPGLLAAARDMFAGPGLAGDRHMATMMWAIGSAFATGTDNAAGDLERRLAATATAASHRYLTEAQRSGAVWAESWALWTSALAALRSTDLPAAEDLIGRCLRLQRDMTDLWGQTWSLELAAWIIAAALPGLDDADRRRAEAERAAWLLGAALERQKALGVVLAGLQPLALGRSLARVAIDTVLGDITAAEHLAAGAHGHEEAIRVALGEPAPRTAGARTAGAGGLAVLTDRERQVARRTAAGKSNAEIATELRLSVFTVETHLRRIFKKTGITRRTELAAWLARAGDTAG